MPFIEGISQDKPARADLALNNDVQGRPAEISLPSPSMIIEPSCSEGQLQAALRGNTPQT